MPDLQRTTLNPANAPKPLGAYSHAVKVTAGSLVYIAGQVGVDVNGNLAGPDVGAQTRQVFENLGHVLAGAGATFANVVEFTTYLVGRGSIQPFIEARTQLFPSLFPNADYPPNTLLVVAGLVQEELLVEIKAVAALP
jgi:enamine deaminase RidA (YjgF/YER057c/UK114 family)